MWRHVLTTDAGMHVEYDSPEDVAVDEAMQFRVTLPDGAVHTFSEFREAIRFVVSVESGGQIDR